IRPGLPRVAAVIRIYAAHDSAVLAHIGFFSLFGIEDIDASGISHHRESPACLTLGATWIYPGNNHRLRPVNAVGAAREGDVIVAMSLDAALGPDRQQFITAGRFKHEKMLIICVRLIALWPVNHNIRLAALPFSGDIAGWRW